ncbi:MAG: UDP-N-acetylmuramate dehydrogenase [Candidatus Saccharimonas sp.]
MDIRTNIPLKNYLTMKIGGNARFMVDIHTAEEIPALVAHASEQRLPTFVLGGGSNTLVRDEGFPGIVLHNRIEGFETLDETPNDVTIRVGAGENWDSVVERTVDKELTGIECLSAIPGTAGAAPVQNIGAYGQEIAETLVSLEAFDTRTGQFVTLTNDECGFGYRSSIFRETDQGRYIITFITLRLFKSVPQPPFYQAVQDYLTENNITIYSAKTLRQAVIAIRTDKLPDPKLRPNAGSFFKNALIEEWQLNDIRKDYPDAPAYAMVNGMHKISTGWLIEQTGLKGTLIHGIRIHDRNALVLINESATSYSDIAAARDEIIGAVRDKFHIQIVQEPLEMIAS